ncbi:MAG: DNA-3-methyladenine glycosylase [Solirubrobacteraceae bacterium]|nr:DNA-3-methyladenine glycosylase [Solirubrobacteraceae bacterium]
MTATDELARFEIAPCGPFSLRAAAGFGFGGSIGAPPWDGAMRLAFAVDGFAEQAGVLLRQRDDGVVEGEVAGACDVDAVRRQTARILSLDHDGEAWLEVGERDPVIGRLQRELPGVRPVLFHSPYEAAAWSIVSARRPARQAAEVRRRLSEQLGATFDVGGVAMAAFPLPERLLEAVAGPGLSQEKVERLHAVARAALDGRLEPERLRAMQPAAAIAELRTLRGIGPFYASLILVRSSGAADVPAPEPRVIESAARAYGLQATPDAQAFLELSERWRPFRTWAVVLLRVAAGDAERR